MARTVSGSMDGSHDEFTGKSDDLTAHETDAAIMVSPTISAGVRGARALRGSKKRDYWYVAQWPNGSVLPSPVPYQTRSALARSPYTAVPRPSQSSPVPLNVWLQRGPCDTGRASSPPQARCTNALHTSQARCHYVPLHQSSPVTETRVNLTQGFAMSRLKQSLW